MISPRFSAAKQQPLGLVLAALVGLLCAGCEVDNQIVTDVGTALLFVQDSDIANQVVALSTSGEFPIQVADFTITQADLTVSGTEVDLLFADATCEFLDTSAVLAFGAGKCAGGVVLDADDTVRPMTLELTFTLEVRRAKPLDLQPGADYDLDGITNELDNCPLIDNPDQVDTGAKGFGDACAGFDPIFLLSELDSDRDSVTDSLDNCVHVPNAAQVDDGITNVEGTTVPDGIGSACTEQVAPVNAGATITLTRGPIDLLQPLRTATLLTVDLRSRESLTCNWSMGSCTLDPDAVRFCVLTTFGACP